MRAGWIGRACLAAALSASIAGCGGGGGSATPSAGSDISFDVPVKAGAVSTIRLRGIERGSGEIGVVLAHMLGSSQSAWEPLVAKLTGRGLHVLTFDFRGHGLSEGGRDASFADLDLAGAVAKLRLLGGRKIFVIGASMGGTAAIKVASTEKLQGVVAISAPLQIGTLDAREAVRHLDEPSLFIAAQGDAVRYTEAAHTFYAAAPQPRTLEIITGTGAHGTDLLIDAKAATRVEQLILDFIQSHGGA